MIIQSIETVLLSQKPANPVLFWSLWSSIHTPFKKKLTSMIPKFKNVTSGLSFSQSAKGPLALPKDPVQSTVIENRVSQITVRPVNQAWLGFRHALSPPRSLSLYTFLWVLFNKGCHTSHYTVVMKRLASNLLLVFFFEEFVFIWLMIRWCHQTENYFSHFVINGPQRWTSE